MITGGPFTSPGATLGFTTISREAARVPEEGWSELVADVVDHLIASALAAPPHLGREELRTQLFPRFSAPGRIPEERLAEDYTYARRVAGMPLLLAVRQSQASAFLADIHLAKAGGAEAAWETAAANLEAAPFGEPTAYRAPSGATVIVFESEHPRQAAWLAYPERLAERLGLEIGPLGVLFCVPAHRQLGLYIVDEETTLADVHRMIELASILGEDEVAPLSPHLFWWRPGEPVTAATVEGPDGLVIALPEGILGTVAGHGADFDTIDG
ncbi:MAG: hypothetical protein HOQ07_06140 [Sinomonas sp.]|nr:hypothetical protein [Sinomonas sp.]